MIQQAKVQHPVDAKNSVIFPIYEDGHFCGKLAEVLGYDYTEELNKAYGEITKISTQGKLSYPTIYVLGLGSEKDICGEKILKAFGKVTKVVKEDSVSVYLKPVIAKKYNLSELVLLATEAILCASYEFKKINKEEKQEKDFEIIASDDVTKEIETATIVASAINHSRTLANMPSNYMIPEDLATYATKLAKECKLEITVFGNAELKEMGAGAILGVNQGSTHEARLIVIKYNGAGDEPYTALVGKGITFDSGGYNLKPSAAMTNMKYDMSGGAVVLGAMEIIAKKKLPVNLYTIVSATENMISGEGYKCDDVLISLSGKTIEVTNTDAEGRIILCDAITYAIQLGATRIVDVATLTGAVRIALGNLYTGVFSNDEEFYQDLCVAAKKAKEKIWRLPLDEEYAKLLRNSTVADIVNSPGKGPGSTIGAEFIHEFVTEGVAWAHLDIAATASSETDHDLGPKGSTGVMVKTLASLFE